MAETNYPGYIGSKGVRKLKAWVKDRFLGKTDEAASAAKLASKTDAGAANKGVYFSNGVPVANTYEVNKDVPADAVFTDTTYNEATSTAAGLMSAADKGKLNNVVEGAQPNVIEGVTVNGSDAAVTGKKAAITVPTTVAGLSDAADYAKTADLGTAASANTEATVANDAGLPTGAAVQSYVKGLGYKTEADVKGIVEGYGYRTEQQVQDAISAAMSATYTPAGSVAFADLPSPAKGVLGNMYNVTDAFVTTADFVEGAGKSYPAGTNVAVVNVGTKSSPTYKYDAQMGFVDLSNCVKVGDIVEMSGTDLDAILAED